MLPTFIDLINMYYTESDVTEKQNVVLEDEVESQDIFSANFKSVAFQITNNLK